MADVVIPAHLAATAVAWEGDRARVWLARLPALVREAAEAWDLVMGPPFEPGGNISWVAPARRRHDDADAVLKLQLPHPESAPEAQALAAWAGDGAVRLLAADADRAALLLERCRPGSALGDEPHPFAAAETGAALGARLHAVAPPAGLPALGGVLDAWASELEDRLARLGAEDPGGGPGPARRALEIMRTRPGECTRPVLLHGDLNPTNVLAAARAPWLAIDPKPMVGDPAYDGARLVTQPDPLLHADPAAVVAGRLDRVADALGVERGRLAEWCLVGAVEVGAAARARGDAVEAARCAAHVPLLVGHLP